MALLRAVSWTIIEGFSYVSSLRLQHVLEQGRLDPSLPAEGATIVLGPDHPDHPELVGVQLVPDASGGAYLLFRACISTLPHTRCYEAAEFRLLRLTSAGTPAPAGPRSDW